MGLIASIYRDAYDSTANAFHGAAEVVIMNIEGPAQHPSADRPAALLIAGPQAGMEPNPIIVPAVFEGGAWVEDTSPAHAGPMFGGTYAGSSDSRFGEAVRRLLGDPDPSGLNRPPFRTASVRSPIPVHDRFETWAAYNAGIE